jgi:hypothetical protein
VRYLAGLVRCPVRTQRAGAQFARTKDAGNTKECKFVIVFIKHANLCVFFRADNTASQLAQSRPKLVKVRLATKQQEAILAGMSSTAAKMAVHAQKGKMAMIQNEARMKALRQQRIAPKRTAAFGDAVAFASGTKKGAAHKRQKIGGTVHRLDGGQRLLKMPDQPLRTTKRK